MNFIDILAPFAIRHGQASGVLPSLILAQGILESGSGTSDLAVHANNLFGIKAGSGWTGPVYTKRTAEQRSDGTTYYIDADFRKYPSYEGCVIDLCHKYVNGTGWEDHNRYAAVLNQTDYKKITGAVYAAGYATDVNYPAKLNKLIEQYDLTKFDKEADNVAYTIINKFISASLYPLKAPYTMVPEYITIHNTYNDATAANEIAYMTRNVTGPTAAVGYHVAIDDKQAVQAIPFTRNAFHAGDGSKGAGNRKSIGIEICYSKSGGPRYKTAEANAVEYVAHLLKQYNWGIERVKWHRDWSGKECPHRIIEEGRTTAVRNAIANRLAELNAITTTPKEGTRMFNPSSPTLNAAYEQFLAGAAKDRFITDKWLTDFKAGKLSLDDALALKVIVDQRNDNK